MAYDYSRKRYTVGLHDVYLIFNHIKRTLGATQMMQVSELLAGSLTQTQQLLIKVIVIQGLDSLFLGVSVCRGYERQQNLAYSFKCRIYSFFQETYTCLHTHHRKGINIKIFIQVQIHEGQCVQNITFQLFFTGGLFRIWHAFWRMSYLTMQGQLS